MNCLKRLIFGVTFLMVLQTIRASVVEADSAYINDDFLNAAALYQQAIDSLGPSAERYYNLGNAYYRAGLLGMAIVSYERAHRLDPSNRDINDNLEFVRAQTKDLIPESDSLFGSAADHISANMHPNTWAWIAMCTFILALAGVVVYFFANGVLVRKIGFFGSGLLLLVCVLSNILAYRGTRKVTSSSEAIVVSPSVILSTTPRQPKDRSEEALLLHEGAKVTIIDSLSTGKGMENVWYDVKVDNDHRAWIQSSAVEII